MGLIGTLKAAWQRTGRASVEEDYLNGARSLVDLEMRQREIDRGRFRSLPHRR